VGCLLGYLLQNLLIFELILANELFQLLLLLALGLLATHQLSSDLGRGNMVARFTRVETGRIVGETSQDRLVFGNVVSEDV
jgi:hypothetical protein